MQNKTTLLLISTLVLLLFSAHVSMASDRITLSAGADYSTGYYAYETETEIWYLPFAIKYEETRWVYKVTIPYIQITGAGNVVGADANTGMGNSTETRTESGMGDVIAAVSYSLTDYHPDRVFLELTGKVKIPTADEERGLGTGEYDYSLQLDSYYSIGKLGIFMTPGYKIYGDPPGVDYRNTYFYSLGASYKLTESFSAGIMYDFRQSASRTGIDQKEITAFTSLKLDKNKKILLYLVRGLTDGSPDQGIGVNFSYQL